MALLDHELSPYHDLPDANAHSWSQAQNHTPVTLSNAKKNESVSSLCLKIHFQVLFWSQEDWEFVQMNAEMLLQ